MLVCALGDWRDNQRNAYSVFRLTLQKAHSRRGMLSGRIIFDIRSRRKQTMETIQKRRRLGFKRAFCLITTAFFVLWLAGCIREEKNELEAEYTLPGMKVHFLDVGQADSTLIQTEDGAMLIDAGNREDHETIINYLDSQGVKTLDYVIGTHPHEDHIGSMKAVMERYDIGTLILPDKIHTTVTYEDMLLCAQEKGLPVSLAEAGKEYQLGENARFTILAPVGDYGDNLNNWSVGVKVTYGEDRFLFCADAEEEAEEDMLGTGMDLGAEVFKVSHHGSDTSNSAEFLDAVSPEFAVISCGSENSYGHPHQEVLSRLESRNVKLYRTDVQGTIVATTRGKGVTFDREPVNAGNEEASSEKSERVKEERTEKEQETGNGKIIVHRTETGGKYHRAECSSLKHSDIELTLEAAKEMGLEPCGRCKPPES